MHIRLICSVIVVLLASCTHKREPMLTERGVVVAIQYGAPIDASGTTTTYNSNDGVGFGSASMHAEEKFMVVFRCEHGVVFSINRKELYAKLSERDSVNIKYYEVVNKKGEIKDLDFVDANKILR